MTRVTGKARTSVCAAILAALPLAGVASAQDGDEQSREQPKRIEEIVVTAQKREETIQKAALSVTALTGDLLQQTGFDNVNDIRTFVPNLNMHTNAGGNTGVTVGIRGSITGDPIITFEPAVGIYTDGLYISKTVGSLFDAPDIERIEVLRGPQGTLYGRNTIGGAINLISKKPAEEAEAYLKLGGGNYDYFNTIAVVDSGKRDIGDGEMLGRLGVRGVFSYRLRDGFYKNRDINGYGSGDLGSNKFDELDRIAARVTTRWEVWDRLTLDYQFDWFRSREVTTAFQLSGVRPGSTIDMFDALLPTSIKQFIETDRVNQIGNNRILTPTGALQPMDGERDSRPLENPLNTRTHNVTGTLDLGDLPVLGEVSLKSISGWRSIDQKEVQDLDGSALHVTDFQLAVSQKQFSQEVQAIGNSYDDRLDYVVALYFFEERGGEKNPQVFFGDIPAFTTAFDSENRFDNTSVAPYGQATLRLPFLEDRFSLTGGLRYTWERKRAFRNYRCIKAVLPFCPQWDAKADKDFQNVSPMGSLAVDITDEALGFFRYARGFKSGGFNGRAPFDEATAMAEGKPAGFPVFEKPFKPETVNSYELGFKTDWFDRRLQLNTTGFFNDIKNRQVSAFLADPGAGAVTFVTNADVEIWGAEVEGVAIPIDGLELRLAYGLLRPEFTKLLVPVGEENEFEDRKDDASQVSAPEHTVSVGIGYTLPPTPAGVLSARVDGYWQDDEDYLLFDNEFIHGGDYFLLNGRIQLAEIPSPYDTGTLQLGVWGRNILDRKYRTFGIDFGDRIGVAGNTYGNPRTFGFDLTWNWGGEDA